MLILQDFKSSSPLWDYQHLIMSRKRVRDEWNQEFYRKSLSTDYKFHFGRLVVSLVLQLFFTRPQAQNERFNPKGIKPWHRYHAKNRKRGRLTAISEDMQKPSRSIRRFPFSLSCMNNWCTRCIRISTISLLLLATQPRPIEKSVKDAAAEF